MSWEADWPEFARSKDASFQSRLVERERQQYPVLVRDEFSLRFLQHQLLHNYEVTCTVIERVRASKNHSRTKMSNFTHQLTSTVEFFDRAVPFIARLSADLLDSHIPSHLHRLYSRNEEDLRTALEKLVLHCQFHIARNSNSTNKINIQHLVKLRSLLDALTTSFTSTVAPLTVAFSIKLTPILNKREGFVREQMSRVAERSPKIVQIRNDMQEMIERRQRLEAGENSLARMFLVLEKFRPSLGMEEEDDEDFDFDRAMEDLMDC
jgi:hypothetical protein